MHCTVWHLKISAKTFLTAIADFLLFLPSTLCIMLGTAANCTLSRFCRGLPLGSSSHWMSPSWKFSAAALRWVSEVLMIKSAFLPESMCCVPIFNRSSVEELFSHSRALDKSCISVSCLSASTDGLRRVLTHAHLPKSELPGSALARNDA